MKRTTNVLVLVFVFSLAFTALAEAADWEVWIQWMEAPARNDQITSVVITTYDVENDLIDWKPAFYQGNGSWTTTFVPNGAPFTWGAEWTYEDGTTVYMNEDPSPWNFGAIDSDDNLGVLHAHPE